MPQPFRPVIAATMASAALLIGACGADETATGPKATPTASGMPVAQYVDEAAGLWQPIADARSDYYHGSRTTRALRDNASAVRAAYAEGARGLADVEPPTLAAELHDRLLAAWRRRAAQLTELLRRDRFDRPRLDDVMAASSRDTATDELYTLPQ